MFEAGVYIERRRRLKHRMGSGLLLFLGNEESPMNYAGNPYPFRQDSSFLYFWGLDPPGLAAVLDVDEDQETIYGADPTLEEVVWAGPQRTLRERSRDVGVARSEPTARLAEALQRAISQGRKVHFLLPYREVHRRKLEALAGIHPGWAPFYASPELIRAVVAQRSAKSEVEVAQIEAALEVSHEMHTLAMRMAKPGRYEREVAGLMEGLAVSSGGRLAYATIFSVHGEVLHNAGYDNRMEAGDLVISDAGASSPLQYASDITRTIPVGGRFTERQRDVYQIVLEAQLEAIRAVRPGIPYKDVHLLASRRLTEGLKALGLVRGDVEEIVQAGAHALFFPHGLGHMMGLDVHDMEGLGEDLVGYDEHVQRSSQFGLSYLRLARTLEPGFVVTVEPGLYFIPELIAQWKGEGRFAPYINYERVERYKDFGGVRVEDDVLVLEEGGRVLGKPIPKTVDEVEAAAAG